MKIIFLQDYQGRETANAAFHAGSMTDVSVEAGLELIRLGVAEEAVIFAEDKPKPVSKKKRMEREVNSEQDE